MNNVVPVNQNQVQAHWSPDQVALVKRTICKDATDDELKLFMHVCQRTGLDPFARQIYATKRFNKTRNEWDMVVQTSIDGFRLAASRSGAYAGSDDPIFDNEDKPTRATVTVYKMVQGTRCPFTATARWKEYYPGEKQGFMWNKMPCVMLGKVAEALALRKAFPADLSGVYAKEEMDQAENSESNQYKRFEEPGNGVQRTDYVVTGNIPKSHAGLVGKYLNDLPWETVEAVLLAYEEAYPEIDKMPDKRKQQYLKFLARAEEFIEGGESNA